MGKQQSAHHVVSFEGGFEVLLVNANADPHQHVLRPLYNLFSVFDQIGALERLKAEVIIVVVSLEVNLRLDQLCVVSNNLVDIIREHWGRPTYFVLDAGVKTSSNFQEARGGTLMEVRNYYSCRQFGIVRVHYGHVSASLSR